MYKSIEKNYGLKTRYMTNESYTILQTDMFGYLVLSGDD